MPTFTKETWVEVDIDVEADEFDDDELIEELEDRGYTVFKNLTREEETDLSTVAWLLDLNKTEEALIMLERMLPQLDGITQKIKSAGVV
jgi:hypothetical protein